jgi:hypothetical protein
MLSGTMVVGVDTFVEFEVGKGGYILHCVALHFGTSRCYQIFFRDL